MITGYEASSSLMISSLANSVIFSQPHKECYDDHHHHYDQNEDICGYHKIHDNDDRTYHRRIKDLFLIIFVPHHSQKEYT